MVVDIILGKKNKSKGQAVFELIIFMPIFLYMTKILFDYGDSINNSINQSKVVRGYYFYTNSNDSNLPNRGFSDDFKDNNTRGHIGLDAFAWSNKSTVGGTQPEGSCVKVPGFLGNEINETCEDPQPEDSKTQYIRSYTAFGVCTGSWKFVDTGSTLYSLNWIAAASVPCLRSETN